MIIIFKNLAVKNLRILNLTSLIRENWCKLFKLFLKFIIFVLYFKNRSVKLFLKNIKEMSSSNDPKPKPISRNHIPVAKPQAGENSSRMAA